MALGLHHSTLPTHCLGAFHPWLLRCERGRLAPESGTPVFACKVTATTFEFLDPEAPRIHPLRVLLGTAVPPFLYSFHVANTDPYPVPLHSNRPTLQCFGYTTRQ